MIEQVDKCDIPIDKNSAEFKGLLNKNVEALFNASSLAKFRTNLFEYQTDEIGNLNDAILKLIYEEKPEKLNSCKDYTLWFSEKFASLQAELIKAAEQHVSNETEQELSELQRHG